MFVKETGKSTKAPETGSRNSGAKSKPSKYTYVSKDEYKRRTADYERRTRDAIARNGAAAAARDRCISSGNDTNCNRFTNVDLPDDPNLRPVGDDKPAAPAFTPQELAYMASARLTLTPPRPVIGPPPELNKWKMAAVGYPLWLWAEGNLNPAPVTDSIYDVSVALDARLVKVVYDMGDGHKVTCTDVSHRWTRAVAAAAKSPTCGYTYDRPSLPKGEYTITANAVWAVDWTINGTSGTIPFYQSATTQLPVGELQVLVR